MFWYSDKAVDLTTKELWFDTSLLHSVHTCTHIHALMSWCLIMCRAKFTINIIIIIIKLTCDWATCWHSLTWLEVSLTLNPLTWKIFWAPNNASKWQMGFNSAFKGLNFSPCSFCLLVCSFLTCSVIYYKAFCLHVATNFFCIPVFLPKLGSCLVLLQSLILFHNLSNCILHFVSHSSSSFTFCNYWNFNIIFL